jgi:hypothetical protein
VGDAEYLFALGGDFVLWESAQSQTTFTQRANGVTNVRAVGCQPGACGLEGGG